MSTDTRSDKRKLIDLKLALSSAAMDLAAYVALRRAAGDSWGQLATRIFTLTGEHVTVPWLIYQLADTVDGGDAA